MYKNVHISKHIKNNKNNQTRSSISFSRQFHKEDPAKQLSMAVWDLMVELWK